MVLSRGPLRVMESLRDKGVFAVDNNVLALEPQNGGGSMLGELTKKGVDEFHFSLIAVSAGDPGLDFKR